MTDTTTNKKKYVLQIPSAPYNPGLRFMSICHKDCIPHYHTDGANQAGYWIIGTVPEDDDYLKTAKCFFCHKE